MFPRWSRHRSKSEPRQGWWMARNSVGLLTWEDAPNVLSVWVDHSQVAATTSLSSKCVPAWTGRDLAPFWRISSKSIDLHIHIINFYSTVGWRCVTELTTDVENRPSRCTIRHSDPVAVISWSIFQLEIGARIKQIHEKRTRIRCPHIPGCRKKVSAASSYSTQHSYCVPQVPFKNKIKWRYHSFWKT